MLVGCFFFVSFYQTVFSVVHLAFNLCIYMVKSWIPPFFSTTKCYRVCLWCSYNPGGEFLHFCKLPENCLKKLLLWFMVVTDHSTLVMGSFSQSCFICTQLILFCGVQFICKIALWVLFLIRSVALCQMSPFIDPWENVILCCCSSTWIANL